MKTHNIMLALFLLAGYFLNVPLADAQDVSEQKNSILAELEKEIQTIYADAAPAIVRISACQVTNEENNERCVRVGSGFVVGENGFIVTTSDIASHSCQLKVMLADNKEYLAELVAEDKMLNIAVLKINAASLKTVRMGSDDTVVPGSIIVSITNPYGMTNSLAVGFVSGRCRSGFQTGQVENYLQTTVPLSPGDTGSPLFNANGEVIGILTAVLVDEGAQPAPENPTLFQINNISLAIPIDIVKKHLPDMIRNGRAERGWIGIEVCNLNQPDLLKFDFSQPDIRSGILITQILPESPAETAGLLVGDIITRFNETVILTVSDLQMAVARTELDIQAELTVIRNNQTAVIHVTPRRMPDRYTNQNH
ncbi:trypsin-like peptidase domain-containing protein [bacterium]|nr:trypsin-like peptidase domain-containing protein [bacterium]